MAQDQRHLGSIGRLARAQDDRHRLAGRRLVDMDRQKAAAVVMRVEQRELLAAMHCVFGIVDVEQDAPRHRIETVAEHGDHRCHHAFERDRTGRFSSRLMVGCEHRSAPLSGGRPSAILKAGSDLSASQSLPSG